jgi:hypothetical protein
VPNSPPYRDVILINGLESAVFVVEYDLDVSGGDCGSGAFVQQGGALLSAEVGVGIAQDKSDGSEEVALAGAISSNDDIGTRRERLNDCLILIAI